MAKKLNILLIMEIPFEAKRGYDYAEELKHPDWASDRKIIKTLSDLGHAVSVLGLHSKLDPLIEELKEKRPDLVFNNAEMFRQKAHFDKNIAWLLDMMEVPYTGASPTSLLLCNNKALSKKILSYHHIRNPYFHTYYRHRQIKPLKKLQMPCIVKPMGQEASRGISLASVVDHKQAMIERVNYIHQNMQLDAIVEEYIEGREFYVGVMGHKRITTFPLREMTFGRLPNDEPRIATYKAKWDKQYRKKWKIDNVPAKNLSEALTNKAQDICKRAYKALNMQCYARFDIRITADEKVYIIEPNANPSLLPNDEFVLAAKRAGISFEQLIKKMIHLAFQRQMN